MSYYCVKQHDITDCGAACLATICKQNGYKIGITKISDEPANVTESVENFYQVTVSLNMDELKDADGNALSLAEGLPCRAGIVTGHERMITYCLKRLR